MTAHTTRRADCFFADGSYLTVPADPQTSIETILELAGEKTKDEVTEIQTDAGIWMKDVGFKTWEELDNE